MPKPKTQSCDACAHAYYWGEMGEKLECLEGHKPRFYKPRSGNDADWGWKRRCDDYVEDSERVKYFIIGI